MAQADMIKDLVKPPFANYDIVVYFGCGLFSLPFIRHYYLEPLNFKFPSVTFSVGGPFAEALIATLALLFSVYIIGHIIAYLGSQIIEKMMDALLGKASTVILISAAAEPVNRNTSIREHLTNQIATMFSRSSLVANTTRAIFHLPLFFHYLAIYILGIFGFYDSRVPPNVFAKVSEKIQTIGLPNAEVGLHIPWYKAVEGYVVNNFPIATARMYNYLVIAGLFRSVCFIFLCALWMELYFLAHRLITGHEHIGIFMSDSNSIVAQLWGFIVISLIYIFCLFSYLKFQRRYVEEALFAFALTREQ